MSALGEAVMALRGQEREISNLCVQRLARELRDYPFGVAIGHPLGFARLRMTEGITSVDNEEFYLHLWLDPRKPESLGDVHTHIFDLRSLVVKGLIRNSFYQVSDADEPEPLATEYFVDYAGAGGIQELRGAALSVRNWDDWRRGRVYFVPLGLAHSSEALRRPTVTLIRKVFPENRAAGPLVYGKPGGGEGGPFRRELTTSQVEYLLAECLEHLNG